MPARSTAAIAASHWSENFEPGVGDVVIAELRVFLQTPPNQSTNSSGCILGQQIPIRLGLY